MFRVIMALNIYHIFKKGTEKNEKENLKISGIDSG